MKLALFKKKTDDRVYCDRCIWNWGIEENFCEVVNEFTKTKRLFIKENENYNGKCRYYKEKK